MLDAASGAAGIVVGTHALLEDKVQFADLGLVVVDEQHRFGVEQRAALSQKSGDATPHVLVMTATPIPRTVAMTVFGDLSVSTLTELPAGRSPITSSVVPAQEKPAWLERAWQRVREEVANGHQAYVVCPRIGDEVKGAADEEGAFATGAEDAGGPDGAKGNKAGAESRRPAISVLEVAGILAEKLVGLRVEVLHGRLAADVKDAVMTRFAAGEIDVLIATTVIEVGRRRAERLGDGGDGRRPVRHLPTPPIARPGRSGQSARAVPAGHRCLARLAVAGPAGGGGGDHRRVRVVPDRPDDTP
jgi:ATP-dependent DNA helicase RecG